ncbi:predicted protein [Naegleria gruberi]|uniref:Predicted protein n=1 Tax=Naegleria gruberi TaxID=5762 RepID=D2VDC5_NAEGR|nr:uncharacterized protein NAEGRDRAFT_66795 [Naegleria gruberi]EFC45120.1 predicted protein [Naegleria gruberi]|eukprot:XP_002677864.1 predicted protein [Naegleria gruberi strain NEG-M]
MSQDEEQIPCPLDFSFKSSLLIQKFETEHCKQLRELTLVVIGAFRKQSDNMSNNFTKFMVACLDKSSGKYFSVCMVGTGFTQELREDLSSRLSQLIIPEPLENYVFNKDQMAEVWFRPVTIFEIQVADICLSGIHKAGFGVFKEGSGLGLRFPRFVKERKFMKPEDITTVDELIKLYKIMNNYY